MTIRPARLALIGLGHVARYQVEALRHLTEELELAAVCDLCPAKWNALREVAPKPGVPVHSSVQELFANGSFDAALVSVPNTDHHAVARAVLEAGVHVVVEKPAAETKQEFEDLAQLATAEGLFFHTAFHAAFAHDLRWFLKHRERLEGELGQLTGFHCGFYDPYLTGGILAPAAKSLGGSWIDSGINALSVVSLIVDGLRLEGSRLTTAPSLSCAQLQGTVDFTFASSEGPSGGLGSIDTNWALGLNRKVTTLRYAQSGHRVELHHSDQAVRLRKPSGEQSTLHTDQALPRLIAHYVGVFREVASLLRGERGDNRARSLALLELLWGASTASA